MSPTSKKAKGPASPPRVCFIYKEDYPWDVRVEKIVRSLVGAGGEVSLLCRNLKRRPRRETGDGFAIHRLPYLPGFGGRFNTLLSIPFYFNPFWFVEILRRVRSDKPQTVIVRDLPLMPISLLVGRMLGFRVIFDMAECYPEMYSSILQYSGSKLRQFVLKNPGVARLMEKIAVIGADHVFVMIEESRDRLLRGGADPSKVTIVSNTPAAAAAGPVRRHKPGEPLRLIYVGFVTQIRGLENALRGIRAYLDRGDAPIAIEFDAVGVGDALTSCRRLVRELDLEECVRFHGWCEQDFVGDLYARSDVGVLAYHVCSHWNHTIPNKLFDYMLAGIPVLATNVVPIQRIVEHVGCGLIVPDGDAAAFAEALVDLADPELRTEQGGKGFAAVKDCYNWENDEAKMHRAIAEMTGGD